jgi:hypothetical protein
MKLMNYIQLYETNELYETTYNYVKLISYHELYIII